MAAISSGWSKPLSGRLRDYALAPTGTLLLGAVQAHMIKEAAKPSTRRQDVIHPSEMAKTDWCPRSTYYRIKACREADDAYLKAPEYVGVQLLNIFDEGHAIHDKWQRRFWEMGLLWGSYNCLKCNMVYPFQDVKRRCPNEMCQGSMETMTYHEVPLRAEQYLISGSADGAIPSKKALIEIKSVGVGTARIEAPDIFKANSEGQKIDLQGLWKDIKEPFPSHVRQGQLYLRLCHIMGLDYDRIVFIYESKFNQGAKEFVVKFDPVFCDDMLHSCLEINGALEYGLEIPLCPTGTSCKDCEQYGNEKSDSVRVGNTEEPEPERIESSGDTGRRNPRPSGRFVRS